MPGPRDKTVLAVVGATASGKSQFALDLAERCGGEIVNTDAMQLYRGMDIGTAKLPARDRRGIPHHLLDLLDIHEVASVAQFQRLARDVIEDCHNRGVTPVLVGGSALYTRAILDEIDFPATDAAVRARLEGQLAEEGPDALHERLRQLDPQAAQAIGRLNGRRIVRALEVIELTGGPYSARIPEPRYFQPARQIGLDVDRPTLDARIEERVDQMWDEGFVDEVAGLAQRGFAQAPTASRAIGYRQVLDLLNGDIDDAEARRRTVFATRRFVRRQDGWFRKDPRVRWLAYDDPDRVTRALKP